MINNLSNDSQNKQKQLNNSTKITQDAFIKFINTIDERKAKEDAKQLVSLLDTVKNKTLSQIPDIITCIVDSYNEDGTINVYPIGEENNIIWTVQNQSIYKNIPIGSPVKVLKQDRDNNINMWIIAVNSIENKEDILYVLREDELEFLKNRINFLSNQFDILESLAINMAKNAFGSCIIKTDEFGNRQVVYKKNINKEKQVINTYKNDKENIINKLKTPRDGTIAKGLFSKI